ncbi:MAG: hypothetical protein QXL86_03730, partial [Candidatus Aenigmatarchaeota archaeon]
MVKLSEIDIGTKDLVVALASALIGYYVRKPIEEMKRAEKESNAQLIGKTAAQYVAAELRSLGIGPESYRAIDELTQTLKELREELKKYRDKNG